MSGLQTIRALLGKMGSEEKKVLRNYLTSFDSRGERFNSKSVKLFDILGDSPNRSNDREIEFFIYGKPATTAFSRLLIRFRDKILESLLLDVNVRRENNHNDYYRNLFEVRKKLSYGQILVGKGLHELAYFMCDSACEICERYELYEEWQQALYLRMQIMGASYNEDAFNRIRHRYEKVTRIARAVFDAYCTYTVWINRFNSSSHHQESASELYEDVQKLKIAAEKTDSDQILFYSLHLEAVQSHQVFNYRQVRKNLEKLRILIEDSEVLYTNQRLANVLLNLANNELYLRRFDRAIEYSQNARTLLHVQTKEEFQSLELEFYAHYYNARFGPARMLLQDLLDRDSGRLTASRRGRRHYILACILFLQGLYREANDLLLELNAIDAEREGWNVWLRILLIMTDIQRSLTDVAGKRMESAKKHLRKLAMLEKANPRDQLIFECLYTLDQHQYDFKAAYQHLSGQFEWLRSNHPQYRWEVKTPEMILFHEWFFAYVIKSEYIHKIPRYSEPDASPEVDQQQ
jgi:tetratricopeptide (TPR) repeat protein